MYDATARQNLEETLGYEGWLVSSCFSLLEQHKGQTEPLTIVIKDAPPHLMVIGIKDTYGVQSAAELVSDMSPLLFCSAFKIIDLILEWCLRENNHKTKGAFFSFRDKVTLCRSKGIAIWPDLLSCESTIRDILIDAYANCRHKRNAIVHNKWGNNDKGVLHFEFEYVDDSTGEKPYPKRHDTTILPLNDILAFASFSERLLSILCGTEHQSPAEINSLKYLANSFKSLHHGPTLTVVNSVFFHVVRQTSLDEIDMDSIRNELTKQSSRTFEFDLRIERGNEAWSISPRITCKMSGTLKLDASLDDLRV